MKVMNGMDENTICIFWQIAEIVGLLIGIVIMAHIAAKLMRKTLYDEDSYFGRLQRKVDERRKVIVHYLTAELNMEDAVCLVAFMAHCPRRGDRVILEEWQVNALRSMLNQRAKEKKEAYPAFDPLTDAYGAYYISEEKGYRPIGTIVNRVCFKQGYKDNDTHIFLGDMLFDNPDETQTDFEDFESQFQ